MSAGDCVHCGAGMRMLFTSFFCPNDCDRGTDIVDWWCCADIEYISHGGRYIFATNDVRAAGAACPKSSTWHRVDPISRPVESDNPLYFKGRWQLVEGVEPVVFQDDK